MIRAEGGEFALGFLDPVFAENGLPGGEGFDNGVHRFGLGHRDQRDGVSGPASGDGGIGDAVADDAQVLGDGGGHGGCP